MSTLFGKDGLFNQLKKQIVERVLESELDHELGYSKHSKIPKSKENRRNGNYCKTILDDDGVAIRAGHHCCQILHDKLGIPASARASIGVYNDKQDIDVLCESIKKCKKVFQI